MNKLLPKTQNNPQGFTLIELMVVIAIIAILSVVGVTLFSNAQKSARDASRRADLDATAKALEVNKTTAGYQVLADTQFSSGKIPQKDGLGRPYCTAADGTTTPAWTSTTDCPTGWSPISATNPAANATGWKICALTENSGVVCVSSAQ